MISSDAGLMPYLHWICALILLAVAMPARAQSASDAATRPTRARLDYAAPEMGTLCPTRESFEDIVAARLGYSAFAENGPMLVTARIVRAGENLHAVIEIRDASNRVLGSREFDGATSECADLAQAMAVAVSVTIDPLSLGGPVEEPHAQASAERDAHPPSVVNESPLHVRAHVDAVFAFGSTPSWALGPRLGVSVRRENFSFAIEGTTYLQKSYTRIAQGDRIAGQVIAGSVVPCIHLSVVQACAVASLGVFLGDALDLDSAGRVSNFWAALGARLGAELPLNGRLSLRLNADFAGIVSRTQLAIDEIVVWNAPAFTVDVGIGILLHFL